MSVTPESQSNAWYHRYDKLVQWGTFIALVIGAGLHYFLVDRPAVQAQEDSRRLTQQLIEESKKSQQLLEKRLVEVQANTDALRANIDQVEAQVSLSKATVDQIQDPIRKANDSMQLERQRLDRVKAIDELVDTLTPNLQVKLTPQLNWLERVVYFGFGLTNAGTRAIRLAEPKVSVTLNPPANAQQTAALPSSSQLKLEVCAAGFISPGETINCGMTLRSDVPLTGTNSISCRANFFARTDLPPYSETSKTLRVAYKEQYLETRMTKSVSYDCDLLRQ